MQVGESTAVVFAAADSPEVVVELGKLNTAEIGGSGVADISVWRSVLADISVWRYVSADISEASLETVVNLRDYIHLKLLLKLKFYFWISRI